MLGSTGDRNLADGNGSDVHLIKITRSNPTLAP